MDRQQIQVSDEERQVAREESRNRRRRKKAITSSSSASMDQISVEFVLPTVARGGSSPDLLLLEVAGNWTVEQVGMLGGLGNETLGGVFLTWTVFGLLLSSRLKLKFG